MTREEAIKELGRISEDTVQRDCSTCGRHTAGTYNGVCCYCSLCQVVPEIFRDYHERKHFRSHWKWDGEWKNEALDMAISALREQEERSNWCDWCEKDRVLCWDSGGEEVCIAQQGKLPVLGTDDWGFAVKFCPMCGRRLEEI